MRFSPSDRDYTPSCLPAHATTSCSLESSRGHIDCRLPPNSPPSCDQGACSKLTVDMISCTSAVCGAAGGQTSTRCQTLRHLRPAPCAPCPCDSCAPGPVPVDVKSCFQHIWYECQTPTAALYPAIGCSTPLCFHLPVLCHVPLSHWVCEGKVVDGAISCKMARALGQSQPTRSQQTTKTLRVETHGTR